jgi:hypothetical protein
MGCRGPDMASQRHGGLTAVRRTHSHSREPRAASREILSLACKGCGPGRLTWLTAGERRRGVSMSDRDSPLITLRSGTPRAHLRAVRPQHLHEAGGGIEPPLSAWEVSTTIRGLFAETPICGILARLAASDRESPSALTRSGTHRARRACERLYSETAVFARHGRYPAAAPPWRAR